jgi:lysophospholipase L1-like esterase
VTCYSRAVGGAKVNDARFWWRRDFEGVAPDLVTIAYGYNPMGATAWMTMLGDLAHPNAEGRRWPANALADWIMERVEGLG